jgi:proline iminopeptidase
MNRARTRRSRIAHSEALIFGFNHLLRRWTVMDRLSEIKAPTLVLAGRQDFQFPPEHQAILADRLPNAQLEIIGCAGHNAHMERYQSYSFSVKSKIYACPSPVA